MNVKVELLIQMIGQREVEKTLLLQQNAALLQDNARLRTENAEMAAQIGRDNGEPA